MKTTPKLAGQMLLVGSACLLLTMIFHPPGGNIEHLIKASGQIIASHSVALIAVPFFIAGFFGFSQVWKGTSELPTLAFFAMLVAQLAGMIAAAINGLALPIFVTNLTSANFQNETVNLVVRNMLALNQAFDLILYGGCCLAILFWSISIVRFKTISSLVGYFGMVMSIPTLIAIVIDSVDINLHTFRLFMSGYVVWTIWVAVLLLRLKEKDRTPDDRESLS